MNAQEAIENEQIELDELKSELKRREFLAQAVNDDGLLNARTFQIEQVKTIEKMIEQKSIVLESAKKLQEIKDKALSYAFIKDIDCSNVDLYDFAKWVYDIAEGFEVEDND